MNKSRNVVKISQIHANNPNSLMRLFQLENNQENHETQWVTSPPLWAAPGYLLSTPQCLILSERRSLVQQGGGGVRRVRGVRVCRGSVMMSNRKVSQVWHHFLTHFPSCTMIFSVGFYTEMFWRMMKKMKRGVFQSPDWLQRKRRGWSSHSAILPWFNQNTVWKTIRATCEKH